MEQRYIYVCWYEVSRIYICICMMSATKDELYSMVLGSIRLPGAPVRFHAPNTSRECDHVHHAWIR